MGEFLQKHSYLIIWILSLVIIGAIAIAIFDLNGYVPTIAIPGITPAAPSVTPAPAAPAPAPVPPPVVTFTIQATKTGNSFFVQWQNLPDGTTALNIFRGKTGTPQDQWTLWKTIAVGANDLANGSLKIDIGNSTEDGYGFYFEAVSGGSGSSASTTLWTSTSSQPIVVIPPPPAPPSPPQGNGSSTSSSTNPGGPVQNPINNNPPAPSSTPTGTPYYNPQVKIETYGADQTGNFWAQHIDQRIQLGWQNLPAQTDNLVISRSQNQNGPWTAVLAQENPAGTYSIQVVDDTLGAPYYYELVAYEGSTTIATYGPEYLASN